MISPILPLGRKIEKIENTGNVVFMTSEAGTTRIMILSEDTIRVSFSEDGSFDKEQGINLNITAADCFKVYEEGCFYRIDTKAVSVRVDKKTGVVSFYKNEKLLMKESETHLKTVEKYDVFRLKKGGKIVTEDINTADGIKKHVVSAEREFYKSLNHTKTFFEFSEDEKIYGLGQYEEGIWDYRGSTRYLHQANKHIAMPVFVSSKGYGVFFTTMSPAVFSDTHYGSYFYTEADYYADYIFTAPDSFDLITKRIRGLAGSAAILPKWAFSYVQSRERYENQQEILDTAAEFKKRNIPLGCIVLDWLSWEDGMWGQKSFDKKRFPDVPGMIKKLNDQGTHFCMSIWPSVDEKCENYKELNDLSLLLPGTNIVDAYCEEGRKVYWQQADRGLASNGVESWWCDSSEPLTPEWESVIEPNPEEKYRRFVECCRDSLYIEKGNAYGMYHAKGMYEGSREQYPNRRVLNLTRNGYLGSHKFGTILWSGDISASYDVFKKQIVEGLQLAICSNAYWTLDIGAFFVKNGKHWYWNGDYDDTLDNFGYRELYTRWLQYGTFLPMFRSHGTDACREPWNFGEEGSIFYDAIVKSIRLREKLMPYIYSLGMKVSLKDEMFIKPLFYSFPKDEKSYGIKDEFMVGDEILVCPVTEPMFYDKAGKEINNNKRKADVYLPLGTEWYDYFTGKKYAGGQVIEADAPIDHIPVFVKAGSIIPEKEGEEVVAHIYPGNSAVYELFEDSGEGYSVESGDYSVTTITWDEQNEKADVSVSDNKKYASEIKILVHNKNGEN